MSLLGYCALSLNVSAQRAEMTLLRVIPTMTFIKGSLVGETSVLRTFRMSGKELVKERVSEGKS